MRTSPAGKAFNQGTTTVTWTVTDASSHTDTCSFDVVVSDNQDPTVTCVLNQNRNTAPNACTYTAVGTEFNPTSFGDNCTGATISYSLSGVTSGTGTSLAGKVFNKGTTTVTWTVTDASSHTDTCSFDVVVSDNQDPTVTCVLNQNRNTDLNACTYTAVGTEFNPTSFGDNCTGATISYSLSGVTSGTGTSLAGKVFNKGTTTVTWTVTDASSHTDTCSFDVVVSDNQDPTVTCVLNQNRNTATGVCTYTAVGTEFNPTSFGDN